MVRITIKTVIKGSKGMKKRTKRECGRQDCEGATRDIKTKEHQESTRGQGGKFKM